MTENHIAEVIRRERLARGWSTEQAAEHLDVDRTAWSRWESGAVSAQLGHAQASTTSNIYGHATDAGRMLAALSVEKVADGVTQK